jgi:hypothetical protein
MTGPCQVVVLAYAVMELMQVEQESTGSQIVCRQNLVLMTSGWTWSTTPGGRHAVKRDDDVLASADSPARRGRPLSSSHPTDVMDVMHMETRSTVKQFFVL